VMRAGCGQVDIDETQIDGSRRVIGANLRSPQRSPLAPCVEPAMTSTLEHAGSPVENRADAC
jgi:hypothetical protein